MAQITQEEFNRMFLVAMSAYGKAQENDNDVQPVTAQEVASSNPDYYSMPLYRSQNNVVDYVKVLVGGQNGLIKQIASEVATTGLMEAITEEEFNEIFT